MGGCDSRTRCLGGTLARYWCNLGEKAGSSSSAFANPLDLIRIDIDERDLVTRMESAGLEYFQAPVMLLDLACELY